MGGGCETASERESGRGGSHWDGLAPERGGGDEGRDRVRRGLKRWQKRRGVFVFVLMKTWRLFTEFHLEHQGGKWKGHSWFVHCLIQGLHPPVLAKTSNFKSKVGFLMRELIEGNAVEAEGCSFNLLSLAHLFVVCPGRYHMLVLHQMETWDDTWCEKPN